MPESTTQEMKWGEGDGGLHQLLRLLHAQLVEHQRQADLTGHGDGNAAQAKNHRIAQGGHQILVPEHFLKIIKTDPLAAPDAQLRTVFLKGQHQAAHGGIAERQVPNQHRQQQHIQQPVVFQPHQDLVAQPAIGARQSDRGFFHSNRSFSTRTISKIIPKCAGEGNVLCTFRSQRIHVIFNTGPVLFPYIVVLTIFPAAPGRKLDNFAFLLAPEGLLC